MDPARWREIKATFADVQALPASERTAALAALSDDLRREVRSLLDASDASPGRLDGDRVGPVVTGEPDEVPARIGPWRIVRSLGHGGMGVVYLGERPADDVMVRAAVKVVNSATRGQVFAERFRSERRILASLDHPGIARFLDGGTTDDGLPYVALEYVDGVPLAEHIAQHQPDLRARLALVRQVCDAVSFAHSRLVVHRDLKPGNILVTAAGTTKLLDFGIAKVLEDDTVSGAGTVTAQGWMTPAYASPEQVRGEPTTTASDVYSLGLVLYEVLVGTAAIARDTPPMEVVKAKLDGTIPRPSTAALRVARTDDGSDAKRRASALRGDLDTIVMTALAVDPTRRYGSVAALSDEIDRYLDGRPIRARGDGWTYRAAKFVRRHRWPVALGAAAAAATVAALIGTTLGLRRAERAELDARASAAVADRVSEFMVGLFNVADPGEARGNAVTARELLDAGAARIGTDLTADPAVQSRLRDVMARAYGELGLYERQMELLQRDLDDAASRFGATSPQALALATRTAVPLMRLGHHKEALARQEATVGHLERRSPVDAVELGRALSQLAMARGYSGDLAGARVAGDRAVELMESAPDRRDTDLLMAVANASIVRWQSGDYDGARPLMQRALSLTETVRGTEHPFTANALNNLAILEDESGHGQQALEYHGRALAIRRRLLAPDHPDIAETLNGMGSTANSAKRYGIARQHLEEALAIRLKVFGPANELVATTEYNLGLAMHGLGETARARELFERARDTFVARLGPTHANVSYPLEGLAMVAVSAGRDADAIRLFEQALALRTAALGATHPAVQGLTQLLGEARQKPRRVATAGEPPT